MLYLQDKHTKSTVGESFAFNYTVEHVTHHDEELELEEADARSRKRASLISAS
jgi:hypothetical protein